MANYSPTKVRIDACWFCFTAVFKGTVEGLPVKLSTVPVSRSDAEVLLRYGIELVEAHWQRLTGRFTFEVFDEDNHRAGIEPYYFILTRHSCIRNPSKWRL